MRDYEELVERLHKRIVSTTAGSPLQDDLLEAADAIEELQAAVEGFESTMDMAFVEENGRTVVRFVPKWISVEERLPEIGRGPVIVYVPPCDDDADGQHYCGYVGMAHHVDPENGGFWCGTDGNIYGAIGIIRAPTHWMPLPEPPKEDDNA